MFRILLVLISTLAPLFIAKAVNGSIETSKALTANAVDRISARVFRQLTWTFLGIAFLATGVILGSLEAAEMWGIAFTPTLGVKLGLVLIGAGCLYVGLRKPEPFTMEQFQEKAKAPEGFDWQSLLAVVLEKMKNSSEPSHTDTSTGTRRAKADLSPEELDRIVAALRNQDRNHETYRSRPSQGPDIATH